jgi:hypothetical protein
MDKVGERRQATHATMAHYTRSSTHKHETLTSFQEQLRSEIIVCSYVGEGIKGRGNLKPQKWKPYNSDCKSVENPNIYTLYLFKILNRNANREIKIILKLLINAFLDSLEFVSKEDSGWNGLVHVFFYRPYTRIALRPRHVQAPVLRCASEILNHQHPQACKDGMLMALVVRRHSSGLPARHICARNGKRPRSFMASPLSHLPFSLVPSSLFAAWLLQVVVSKRRPSRCCCR